MPESKPRTTTVYLTEDDKNRLNFLCEQTGLSRSGLIRHLVEKEVGATGSQTEQIRELVAALAKIVL